MKKYVQRALDILLSLSMLSALALSAAAADTKKETAASWTAAAETVDGPIRSVHISILSPEPMAEKALDFVIRFIGVNTDYTGDLWMGSRSDASYFLPWANFGKTSGCYSPYAGEVNEDGSLRGHELLDAFFEVLQR